MRAIAASITLLAASISVAQPSTCPTCGPILDSTIAIMRTHATYTKLVDWETVAAEAHALAHDAQGPEDLGPAMVHLFQAVNDHHGAFFHGDDIMFQWTHNAPVLSDVIRAELFKGPVIGSAMLDDSIGYLRIPSMPAYSKESMDRLAQELNDHLCALLDRGIRGLIIDLRLNGGGAMHPMIMGITHLLPKGPVGSHVTSTVQYWHLGTHDFRVDGDIMARIVPRCDVDATRIPVALLTSPITGSAAECLIVAMQGRPNTVITGTPTAGFLSINQGFMIDGETGLNLSVGYNADRSGRLHRDAFTPDIPIEAPDVFANLSSDAKVQAAIAWLRNMRE